MAFALTSVTVLDGTRGMEPQRDTTIVIGDDGRIQSVCPDDEITLPMGMVAHELDGAYVVPGLVNLHTHFVGSGAPRGAQDTKSLLTKVRATFAGKQMLRHEARRGAADELAGGVTCARGAGDPQWVDVNVKQEVRDGKLAGPQVLACGGCIVPAGGHGVGMISVEAATTTDAMNLVKEAYAQGADHVMCAVTAGVYDAAESCEPKTLMKAEMLKAIVATAHALAMPVMAHCENAEGVRLALECGVDSVEHGSELDDETLALFKTNGVGRESSLTVTISSALPLAALDRDKTGSSEEVQECARIVLDRMVAGAKQALAAGVTVGIGADSGYPYVSHHDMWREVAYYDRLVCHDPRLALHTATQLNAQIAGVADVCGTIEPGKRADLLVVGGNPLRNLEALGEPAMICCNGVLNTDPKPRRDDDLEGDLDAMMADL